MFAPPMNERQSPAFLRMLGSNEKMLPGWRWFIPADSCDYTPENYFPVDLYWVHDDVPPGTAIRPVVGARHQGLDAYDIIFEV